MDDDFEAFVRSRRYEIARELIVFGVSDLKRVFPARISFAKALLADLVGNIEPMKLVRHLGLCQQRMHPVAIPERVGREIQHHRQALAQDIDDIRPHRRAKPCRQACVVVDGLEIIGEQIGRPVIFADEQGRRA